MKPLVLTPWFDGKLHKPIYLGVYKQMFGPDIGYQKWDGVAWGPWKENVEAAAKCKPGEYAMGFYQSDDWQGILKEPEASLCQKFNPTAAKQPQTEETILDRLADLEARVFQLENPQHGVRKEM